MTAPIRILMQTTIPFAEDDWHIGRFSLLRDELASLKDDAGNPLYEVTTRDRESDAAGNDPVLSTLDTSDFKELWLFAVDTGDGLTGTDCQGITRFRQRGGGIMATRDHQDLGTSLCTLGGIGRAHFFHSKIPSPILPDMFPTIRSPLRSHGPTIIRAPTATTRGSAPTPIMS